MLELDLSALSELDVATVFLVLKGIAVETGSRPICHCPDLKRFLEICKDTVEALTDLFVKYANHTTIKIDVMNDQIN